MLTYIRSKKKITHVQVYSCKQSSQTGHTSLQLLTAHCSLTLLTSYNFTLSDLFLKFFSFVTFALLKDIRLLASLFSLMKSILELCFPFVSFDNRSEILSLLKFIKFKRHLSSLLLSFSFRYLYLNALLNDLENRFVLIPSPTQ